VTTDIDTSFPTTTFESVEFTGAGAMKSNFKGEIKFEVANLPQVLVQLQGLHATKGKLVFVSDQGQIPDAGDEVRDWASTELQQTEEAEVEYGRTCIGGDCPHFCVPKEGDLAGEYVCYQDVANEVLVVCEYGVTPCPLGAGDGTQEADDDTEEAVGETDAEDSGTIPDEAASDEGEESAKAARGAGVVIVLYPGDEEPHVTQVGDSTLYGELVFDYFTSQGLNAKEITAKVGDYIVSAEDELGDREQDMGWRSLEAVIDPADYGKRFVVAAVKEPAEATA